MNLSELGLKLFMMKYPFQVVNKYSLMKVSEHHLVSSLIKLFDCYLIRLVEGAELKGKSETELTPLFEGMFFFSCIWSIGSVCDSDTKKIFDMVFNELLRGTGIGSLNGPKGAAQYLVGL